MNYDSLFFRRLFPALVVSIQGLERETKYIVSAHFASADKYRYKFMNGQWQVVGESDIIQNEALMVLEHDSSPMSGDVWMKKPVSFKKIKITHHASSKHGNVSF